MADRQGFRKSGLASARPRRYASVTVLRKDSAMVAIAIIFGFLAVIAAINFFEFGRID